MLPAMSAAIEPTDRSMPPEMMTKVIPTAMMPMNDVRVSTFIALSTVAKSPLSKVPPIHSAISPMSGPTPNMKRATVERRLSLSVSSVCAGRMRDQPLFSQKIHAERRDELARAHHADAMAQADQLDQLG